MNEEREDGGKPDRDMTPAASRRSRRSRSGAIRLRSDSRAAIADKPSSEKPLTCFQVPSRQSTSMLPPLSTDCEKGQAGARSVDKRGDERQQREREDRGGPGNGLVDDRPAGQQLLDQAAGMTRIRSRRRSRA